MPLPVLVVPPRPSELPASLPPPADEQQKPFLRNDALSANWVEQFERAMKDAWIALNKVVVSLETRVSALEQRIADTYTYGQRGGLQVLEDDPNWIGLPLRVVRNELLLECVGTLQTAPTDGTVTVEIRHNAAVVTVLDLAVGATFVSVALPAPRGLLKNDTLTAVLTAGDPTAADVVVQLRCR